jgi:hypothetical protein
LWGLEVSGNWRRIISSCEMYSFFVVFVFYLTIPVVVEAAVSPGVGRQGREADHSPPSSYLSMALQPIWTLATFSVF